MELMWIATYYQTPHPSQIHGYSGVSISNSKLIWS